MCSVDEARNLLHNYYVEAESLGTGCRGLVIASKHKFQLIKKTETYIAVEISKLKITAMVFYYPPKVPPPRIVQSIAEAMQHVNQNISLIIAGDFNCRMDAGTRGVELCEGLQNLDLSRILCHSRPNARPDYTYLGPNGDSTIDLIFTRNGRGTKIHATDLKIHHTYFRKHGQLIFNVCNSSQIVAPLVRKKGIRRTIDMGALRSNPAVDDLRKSIADKDVETATSNMEMCLTSAIPQSKRSYNKPWFDRECSEKKASLAPLYRHRKRSRCCREAFWKCRSEYKRLCNQKKKTYEEESLQRLLTDAEKKPWLLFKGIRQQAAASVNMEEMCGHFRRLLNPTGQAPDLSQYLTDEETTMEWYDRPFTKYEVETIILNSSDRKATGPDYLSNEHIKQSADFLLTEWTQLFNACFTEKCIPRKWRESFLKILYKGKGDPKAPKSYRGISLLCCPFKMLTSLMNRRISRQIERVLPDNQYGYRPHRSTMTPLKNLLERAVREMQNTGLWVLFVDFSSAFPSLNRGKLIEKLRETFGIRGRMLNLIVELLRGSSFRIDDGVNLSDKLYEHKGVPQGDSLSPTLFLCYVADLSEELNSVTDGSLDHALYADDLEADSAKHKDIQKALNTISNWCHTNDLEVNISKTKVMKLRNGGRISSTINFNYRGSPVEIANEYEYLGVTLQPTLTFTRHIRKKRAKCACVIGSLRNLQKVSLPVAAKIFRIKVQPIIEYGLNEISPFLTLPQLLEIDKIKASFVKKVLGVHVSASSTVALMLAEENSLVEDLSCKLDLDENVWFQYCDKRQNKIAQRVEDGYLLGPGFSCDRWKTKNQNNRHVITRLTIHGFHHRVCNVPHFHEPGPGCRCLFCESDLDHDRYHILVCDNIYNFHDFVY